MIPSSDFGNPASLRRGAFAGDATQGALKLGHAFPDATELHIRECTKPHRRACDHRGGSLSCQKQRDLSEHITRPEHRSMT